MSYKSTTEDNKGSSMSSPPPVGRHKPATFFFLTIVIAVVAWLLATTSLFQPIYRATILPRLESGTESRLISAYGNLPLQFEANQGQAPAGVKFISRGSSYNVHFKSDEAILSLRKSESKTSTVRLRMLGGHPAQISARDELPGRVNYFVGNDPSKWQTDIKTYKEVLYRNVYPGVDLVYYGNQGKLEYDFVVAPGIDPRVIQISFTGADDLRLDETGALIVKCDDVELVQPAPILYQETSNGRKQINGRYVFKGVNTFAFEVDDYDRNQPLVIDPTLTYSTFVGPASTSGAFLDTAGNGYITGSLESDAFVYKLNPTGTALIYSTVFGGSSTDAGTALAVDAAGNIYVTGRTSSPNFPIVSAAQSAMGGDLD